MNEIDKYTIIKNLIEKNGNKQRAAIKLNCNIRTIYRLINIYNKFGKEGFIHGNRYKSPIKTIPIHIKNEIVILYSNKYKNFNIFHFQELLKEKENIIISYGSLYNILYKEKLYSPKIHKRTRKNIKKSELMLSKTNCSKSEIDGIVNHQLALEDSHPRRERSKYFGELLQMDASNHVWFGETKSQLHLSIDDATGTIVGAIFQKEETLFGYYSIFKQTLYKYGIPAKFLTDNRTVFNYNSHGKSSAERDVLTQFGYACKTLGVSLETTSIAQAKGRVERVFQTLQSRLANELKLENIQNIEEANLFLKLYIKRFNKRFALPLNNIISVFEKQPSASSINTILALLEERTIDNGNSIKYKSKYYQPYKYNAMVTFQPKTKCLVIKCFDGTLLLAIDEEVYQMKILSRNERFSKEFDTIPKEKIKKKYIPPMTHPWKLASFQKYREKAHTSNVYA
jgi:predicted lactoylglutathione lyase